MKYGDLIYLALAEGRCDADPSQEGVAMFIGPYEPRLYDLNSAKPDGYLVTIRDHQIADPRIAHPGPGIVTTFNLRPTSHWHLHAEEG